MDFLHDTLGDGRPVRVLTMLDVYARQCVALAAASTFSGGQGLGYKLHLTGGLR